MDERKKSILLETGNFVTRSAILLADAGLPDADTVLLITGGMTVNQARAKLGMMPLDEEEAGLLFCLEPHSMEHVLHDTVVTQACKRLYDGETEALRSFRDELIALGLPDLQYLKGQV